MKKNIALFAFLLMLSNSLLAQYDVPGYIIRKTMDTIWGIVSIKKKKMEINMDALYTSVIFTDSSNQDKSKETFNANEIRGFGVRGEDIHEDFISGKSLTGRSTKFFYRRIEMGYIELFESIEKISQQAPSPLPPGQGSGFTTIYHKEHTYYIKIGGLDIESLDDKKGIYKKKYLSELFKNHPELLNKIETDIDFTTLLDLIRQYNKKYLLQ